MKHVITLMANTDVKPINDNTLYSLSIAFQQAGIKIEKENWLAPNEAVDVFVDNKSCEDIYKVLQGLNFLSLVDRIVQPVKNRRKKLLVTDMDSTIINEECIDELAAELGLRNEIASITERAMNGKVDFKTALKERVALLEGLTEESLKKVYDDRITIMEGAKPLIATMKANGAYCVLISGGFTMFTEKIAKKLGFDEDRANDLVIKSGKLTGEVKPPILDKDNKLSAINDLTNEHKLTPENVIAVGDGANDVPMLEAAGLGVAYHAKPVVKESLPNQINFCNLKALLYAQGYSKDEITE